MSTAALAICSIDDTTCSTELMPSTSRGVAHGQHRQRPHLVHESGHVHLEAQHGICHAFVVEVERGIGQIDHEL